MSLEDAKVLIVGASAGMSRAFHALAVTAKAQPGGR